MQRKAIIAVAGGLLCLALCSLTVLFLDGYYLPFKPCRPITYPEGNNTSENFLYTATTGIDTVLAFYDERLDIQPRPGDIGLWRREELEDARYLYSCYGVDINGLSTETGCIYVSEQKMGTRVEGMLFRSEGDNLQCPRK